MTIVKVSLTPEPADSHHKNYMEKYWLMTIATYDNKTATNSGNASQILARITLKPVKHSGDSFPAEVYVASTRDSKQVDADVLCD